MTCPRGFPYLTRYRKRWRLVSCVYSSTQMLPDSNQQMFFSMIAEVPWRRKLRQSSSLLGSRVFCSYSGICRKRRWGLIRWRRMGVSSIEDCKNCPSPRIYQPAEERMELPRKKKTFSSSSFYEEPNAIYPTVEEQVKLCRRIAESLSDDCNVKSKGANMFFKRVKKAENWIVAESAVQEREEEAFRDPTTMPYVRPNREPRLKLILDPRHIVDMDVLLKQGVDVVQHNAISPEICHDLVRDLTSTDGRGGQLFAKRKKKSEEWVVDEEKVKQLLHNRHQEDSQRLSDIAQTVIRAAEAKVMTYPNAVPHVPVIESLDSVWSPEAYKEGWNTSSSSEARVETPLRRTVSFNNFNSSPRAWNADSQFRPTSIRSVKPPSVLMVQ